MTNDIMVSICCLAYNHEKYIKSAIEGFLMQKTNFKYEIIIHEDASTDKTVEIIKYYEKKHPDIIKPIYQKENQYSKGVHIDIESKARGKYIALCEGDDYWIDEYKLQKQVKYMEDNPECTFCFHNSYVEDQKKENKKRKVIPWLPENRKFYDGKSRKYFAGELQLLGFIPTMSFLYPKKVIENLPNWYFEAPVGDTAVKLLASSQGYAYYMDEVMSVYRFNVAESATTKWNEENIDQTLKRYNDFINMLNDFNIYSNYKYNSDIELAKLTWEVQSLLVTKNYKELKNKKYKEYIKLHSGIYRYKYNILISYPKIVSVYSRIKSILA